MNRIELIDEINYIFNIISSVTKQKITISDFCKMWYSNKMFKQYNSPEEALYELFCNKVFDTYTMHIPNLPIVTFVHKNDFVGEFELGDNWNCKNCVDCKWCVDCSDCSNCVNSIGCISCDECYSCIDCIKSNYMYKCKHITNSSYLVFESSNSNVLCKCDSNCNWNCDNCVDCVCCMNSEDCVNCCFINNCTDCKNMNIELFDKVKKLKNNQKYLFKIFILLDRFGMLSSNCKKCNDCNYLYDAFDKQDITMELDLDNVEILNNYIDKFIAEIDKS